MKKKNQFSKTKKKLEFDFNKAIEKYNNRPNKGETTTLRKSNDETTILMKALGRCWIFHKWSLWTTAKSVDRSGNQIKIVEHNIQARICLRCGFKQAKEVFVFHDSALR